MTTIRTNMDNPFIFNGYNGSEYFCDREKELETLMKCATTGVNVTLIAQRRMGKTGLIFRLMDEINNTESGITPIYIDIFATRNLEELNRTLASAILTAFPEESSIGKRFMTMLKGLRPMFGIDPLSGSPKCCSPTRTNRKRNIHLKGCCSSLKNNPPLFCWPLTNSSKSGNTRKTTLRLSCVPTCNNCTTCDSSSAEAGNT